ncbi:unnamed protein product [Peronospora farinosa]|uniref:Uncharacterized protein n=1 Tax=Peronospora farinosa TaxID=134698 RepID=A0ABN8CGM4_9STRA|nr:unnamed protein product [Peronospora farinosa]
MDADAPAAAQISQADIIERQAESIARLKRQVQKGVEYKQLTKSKLKEAAARLKEYRVRVETLFEDVETLQKQLKVEKCRHEKTKKRYKNGLNQDVKTLKQKVNASTQTQESNKVTRTCQTLLSGQVEQVNKRTMRDHGVQTMDILTCRKSGREQNMSLFYHQMDQCVPKCSRRPQKDPIEDTFTPEPLQVLGSVEQTTFLQETSAALDAELAFSDSEDESHETRDNTVIVNSGLKDAGLNLTVLDEIDKELEMSSNEEEQDNGVALVTKNGYLMLNGSDQVVLNNVQQKLGTRSEKNEGRNKTSDAQGTDDTDSGRIGGRNEFAAGEKNAVSAGFDFAISNAIDKDLESSSGEEDGVVNVGDVINTKKSEQTVAARVDVCQSKWTLMSIDDELDDEFAALEADSDAENHGKAEGSSKSGLSSEHDLSDSSDSESDDDGDDPMTGKVDSVAENESLGPVKQKNEAETTTLQAKTNSEVGVSSLSPLDKDAVVVTTPVEKKFVGASTDVYSPMVDAKLTIQSERMQLDTPAEVMISTEEKKPSTVAVNSQPTLFQKNALSCIQPSSDFIADAGATATPDTQTSSDNTKLAKVPVRKQSASVTSSSSTNKPSELELYPAKRLKQPSDHTSHEFPGTPTESGKQNAKANRADKHASSIIPATEVSTIGNVRKADKANLEDSQATLHKKIKLNDVCRKAEDGTRVAIPQTKSSTSARKKKSAAEAKEQLRLKKSLSTFKQALVLGKGEEPDKEYTRRTISVLVTQCSNFVDTYLDHVITLCRALADAYREQGISPMLVVRGSLSLFRTPRSRRLMPERKSLSWLCNQVLTRVLCSGNEELEQDGCVASKSFCLSTVDECLLHLRGLLVEERTNIGEFLSQTRVHVQVTTRQVNISHDKVFLAHVCALHTHLCRFTGQLVRSRVLLFDLVRDNPNIRGLYFAMVMLKIYPAILEREFDQHCIERQMVLKETLQQALVVISGVSAAKQELLLLQPSIAMLHTIANALQMPELEDFDGSESSYQCACVEKIFSELVVLCQSSKSEQEEDEGRSPVSADYFVLAKSMEICSAVYGIDLVVKIFNIDRCQELYSKANIEGKIGIMHLVGHIAMGIASKKSDMHDSRTRSGEYIESVTDWMCQILSSDEKSSPEDRFRLTFGCSTICVELILEYSTIAGLKCQRQVLCAVIRWFDAIPSDQLIDLPATFLRRLRLAVVAARPQVLQR